jgi:hypothetical protein
LGSEIPLTTYPLSGRHLQRAEHRKNVKDPGTE